MAPAGRAREATAASMPASSSLSLSSVSPYRIGRRTAAGNDLVHLVGRGVLAGTAAADPHEKRIAVADEAVDVDARGANAEARDCRALHQEQRRILDVGGNAIGLVAPAAEDALGDQGAQRFLDGPGARFHPHQSGRQPDRVDGDDEHVRQRREPGGELRPDQSDGSSVDAEGQVGGRIESRESLQPVDETHDVPEDSCGPGLDVLGTLSASTSAPEAEPAQPFRRPTLRRPNSRFGRGWCGRRRWRNAWRSRACPGRSGRRRSGSWRRRDCRPANCTCWRRACRGG